MPVPRVAQLVKQAASVLELIAVLHPELRPSLIKRQLARDAAGVGALHRGGHAGVAQHVSPERGEGEIGRGGQAFHQCITRKVLAR